MDDLKYIKGESEIPTIFVVGILIASFVIMLSIFGSDNDKTNDSYKSYSGSSENVSGNIQNDLKKQHKLLLNKYQNLLEKNKNLKSKIEEYENYKKKYQELLVQNKELKKQLEIAYTY